MEGIIIMTIEDMQQKVDEKIAYYYSLFSLEKTNEKARDYIYKYTGVLALALSLEFISDEEWEDRLDSVWNIFSTNKYEY